MVTYTITEAMNAGSSVGQDVERFERKACVVEVVAAASFTGIGDRIAHARLITLRLTERQARPIATQTLLQTFRSVRLRCRCGTLRLRT